MFCSITFKNSGGGIKGFFQRLRGFCEIEKISIGNSCFYHIIHHCKAGKINWRRLEKAAGGHKCVLQTGINLPKTCKIKLFDTANYQSVSIIALFIRLLKNSPKKTVGLFDENGKLMRTAAALLPLCAQLIVYTKAPEKYESFCEDARDILGTAPIVTSAKGMVSGVSALLSPLGGDYFEFSPLVPVFGVGNKDEYHISDECLELPEDIESLKPAAISSLDFLAAATEGCGLHFQIAEHVKSLCKNGGVTSLLGMYYFS